MNLRPLPLLALATALALAGCNKTPETNDAAINEEIDMNGAVFNGEAPVIEPAGAEAEAAIPLVSVPQAPAGATAADTAPLDEARAIEGDIRATRNIERVRYGAGWAWMREGRILRTADLQGRNIAYFRGGEDKPFFVQHEGRSYAYQGDKPTRVFGTDGQVRDPDADRIREGNEAARTARNQRQDAETARNNANARGDREALGSRVKPAPAATATPMPLPSAAATPAPRDRSEGRDRTEGRRDGTDPRPTPSPRPERDR